MTACAASSEFTEEANRKQILVLAYVEERTPYSEVVSFLVYDPDGMVPQGLLPSHEPRYSTCENLVSHGTVPKRLVRETSDGRLGVADRVIVEECSRFSLDLASSRNVTIDLSAVLTGRGTHPVFVCEDGLEIIGVGIVRGSAPAHCGTAEESWAGASKRIVKAGAYWLTRWHTDGKKGLMHWEMALPALFLSKNEAKEVDEWLDTGQLLRCR